MIFRTLFSLFPKELNLGEQINSIDTVLVRPTFWKKASILYAEYHRPLDKPMLHRYSRHYADLATMAQTLVKDAALSDLNLLPHVCLHKDRFYHCGWTKYMEAKPGSFHLVPRQERLNALGSDYQNMRVMFFEQVVSFDEIMNPLSVLVYEINSLALP